jgi:colanic acid/amylovoran biosynthesis protein
MIFSNIKSLIHQMILLVLWIFVRTCLTIYPRKTPKQSNILLIPAAPEALVGSKGDEAMMVAVIDKVKQFNATDTVAIACTSSESEKVATQLRLNTFPIWGGIFMPIKFLRSLNSICPKMGIIMGADVMDGFYSPVNSMRMVIAADILAKTGSVSRFLGFSFNKRPASLLKFAFRMLDEKVVVNLRDPISLQRYENFTGKPANLVADTAFLLKAEKDGLKIENASKWILDEKSKGRRVIAINFHSMLYRAGTETDITQLSKLTETIAMTMEMTSEKYHLSWLLLPHDDRDEAGDKSSLAELHNLLRQKNINNVFFINTPPSAAQIKALVADLDGVITGRMHLAIATLGQAVPILAIAYQGKFEGLVKHFDLPEWIMLDPIAATKYDQFSSAVDRFISELHALKSVVGSQLPKVLASAEANFEAM